MGADNQPSVLHRRTLVVDGYRGELLVVILNPVFRNIGGSLSEERWELSRLARTSSLAKSGERGKVMLNAGLSRA